METSYSSDNDNESQSSFSCLTRTELEQLCVKYTRIIATHEIRMKEVNELLCANLKEMRQLKDINKKLTVDNKQLQDLCCFIDNDRLEGRKLAKEWQKFGKYSSDVVKNEVPVYKEKLNQLQSLQEKLIELVDNFLSVDWHDSKTQQILQESKQGTIGVEVVSQQCNCHIKCPVHSKNLSVSRTLNETKPSADNNRHNFIETKENETTSCVTNYESFDDSNTDGENKFVKVQSINGFRSPKRRLSKAEVGNANKASSVSQRPQTNEINTNSTSHLKLVALPPTGREERNRPVNETEKEHSSRRRRERLRASREDITSESNSDDVGSTVRNNRRGGGTRSLNRVNNRTPQYLTDII